MTTPIMVEYQENLTSFDGGSHSLEEAKQITTDVSKFLAYADSDRARWSTLTDMKALKGYVTKLTRAAEQMMKLH